MLLTENQAQIYINRDLHGHRQAWYGHTTAAATIKSSVYTRKKLFLNKMNNPACAVCADGARFAALERRMPITDG